MFLNYPFLQKNVTDVFNPGVTHRHSSYAYYTIGEGYLFMGFPGFLYSGIVAFLGITLWRMTGRTTSIGFNALIIGMIASQFANFSRGQSAYFVKHYYLFLLPAILLYLIVSNKSLRLNK